MTDPNPTILVINDEPIANRLIKNLLLQQGYNVLQATNGEEGILQAQHAHPALILIDPQLPDIDGIEVTRRIRETAQTPIVFLTYKNEDAYIVEALDAGADDYITWPFSIEQVFARLRVALRHAHNAAPPLQTFHFGEIHIDLTTRKVTRAGAEVQLTPTEYDLLRILIRYAGRVVTHQQLLKEVRGIPYQTETHLLRVHMSNLRHKLEQDAAHPQYILTEAGVGYRLVTATEDAP